MTPQVVQKQKTSLDRTKTEIYDSDTYSEKSI